MKLVSFVKAMSILRNQKRMKLEEETTLANYMTMASKFAGAYGIQRFLLPLL